MINLYKYIQQLRLTGQITWKTQTTKAHSKGNKNLPISIKEMKFIVKTFPQRKLQAQIATIVNSSIHLRISNINST